jgi:hypothetical protein
MTSYLMKIWQHCLLLYLNLFQFFSHQYLSKNYKKIFLHNKLSIIYYEFLLFKFLLIIYYFKEDKAKNFYIKKYI